MDEVRNRLDQDLKTAISRLGHLSGAAAIEERPWTIRGSGPSADEVDGLQANESREVGLATRELLMERVNRLSAALDRMSKGAYGTCVECGDAISAARLRAMPEVQTCVRCQDGIERVGRHVDRSRHSVFDPSEAGAMAASNQASILRAIPPERRRPRCTGSRHAEIRGQLLSDSRRLRHDAQADSAAIPLRCPGAVYRCRDDGAPSRQASSGVRRQPEQGDRAVSAAGRSHDRGSAASTRPGSRGDPDGRSEPRRRPRQPSALLGDPRAPGGRAAEGRDRRRHHESTSAHLPGFSPSSPMRPRRTSARDGHFSS